jgi:hypothetical protein
MKRSNLFKSGFGLIVLAILALFFLLEVNSCAAQEYVARDLVWDYDHFALYPDSAIHFIVYMKIDADTAFSALDTTGASALEYHLLDKPWLYTFQWRSFFVTAILYDALADDYSYESGRSNIVREYFRTLPPLAPDSTAGLVFRKIELGKVQ